MQSEYAAGYIDGEGCMTVSGGSIRVSISNTYLPTLRLFKDRFGGHVSSRKVPEDPARRRVHEYSIYGDKAEALLCFILPHLKEKMTQAALLIEYHRADPKSPRRPEILTDLSRLKRPTFSDGEVSYPE